jgi:hypothetical protein
MTFNNNSMMGPVANRGVGAMLPQLAGASHAAAAGGINALATAAAARGLASASSLSAAAYSGPTGGLVLPGVHSLGPHGAGLSAAVSSANAAAQFGQNLVPAALWVSLAHCQHKQAYALSPYCMQRRNALFEIAYCSSMWFLPVFLRCGSDCSADSAHTCSLLQGSHLDSASISSLSGSPMCHTQPGSPAFAAVAAGSMPMLQQPDLTALLTAAMLQHSHGPSRFGSTGTTPECMTAAALAPHHAYSSRVCPVCSFSRSLSATWVPMQACWLMQAL